MLRLGLAHQSRPISPHFPNTLPYLPLQKSIGELTAERDALTAERDTLKVDKDKLVSDMKPGQDQRKILTDLEANKEANKKFLSSQKDKLGEFRIKAGERPDFTGKSGETLSQEYKRVTGMDLTPENREFLKATAKATSGTGDSGFLGTYDYMESQNFVGEETNLKAITDLQAIGDVDDVDDLQAFGDDLQASLNSKQAALDELNGSIDDKTAEINAKSAEIRNYRLKAVAIGVTTVVGVGVVVAAVGGVVCATAGCPNIIKGSGDSPSPEQGR